MNIFMDWILNESFEGRTNYVTEPYRMAYAIEMVAKLYLKDKGMNWHHAMKKLLSMFISHIQFYKRLPLHNI